MKRLRVWFAVGWAACGLAHAHTVGISTARGQMTEKALEIVVGFAPGDAHQLLKPADRPQDKWSPEAFEASIDGPGGLLALIENRRQLIRAALNGAASR